MGLKANLLLDALASTQLFSEPLRLIPLQGGAVNQSYKLISSDSHFFLKTFEQAHLIASDRQEIYLLQAQLALLGIAALPIYLSDKQAFQVEQWVDRQCLASADLSRTEQIYELAGALYHIHKQQVPAKKLDLPSLWQRYIDCTELSDDSLLTQEIERCQKIWLSSCQHDQVLCHNDLVMDHVMLGKPSVVLDWEYAAKGNRFFDLASSASINEFNPAEILLLQKNYSEHTSLPLQHVQQQMNVQRQLVALTNQLWYMAAGINKP
jgi:thiamine kinase-like enzyme